MTFTQGRSTKAAGNRRSAKSMARTLGTMADENPITESPVAMEEEDEEIQILETVNRGPALRPRTPSPRKAPSSTNSPMRPKRLDTEAQMVLDLQQKGVWLKPLSVVLNHMDNATLLKALKSPARFGSPEKLNSQELKYSPKNPIPAQWRKKALGSLGTLENGFSDEFGSVPQQRSVSLQDAVPKRTTYRTSYGRITNALPKPQSLSPKRSESRSKSLEAGSLQPENGEEFTAPDLLEALGLRRRGDIEILEVNGNGGPVNVIDLFKNRSPLQSTRNKNSKAVFIPKPKIIRKKPIRNTCYACLKDFYSQGSFTLHRRQHIDNKCPDPECGEVFESYWQLKNHVLIKIRDGKLKKLLPIVPNQNIGSITVKRVQVVNRNLYGQTGSGQVLRNQNCQSATGVGGGHGLGNQNTSPPKPQPGLQRYAASTWAGGMVLDASPAKSNVTATGSPRTLEEDVYPPHFMQSFMDVDVDLTRENPETPQPIQTPQPLIRGRGHGVVEITRTRTPSASVNIPTYNLPVSRASTATLTGQYLAPRHLSATSESGSFPQILSTVDLTVKQVSQPSPSRSATVDADYSSYADLLGPLNKMKKFALGQKDGAILFTVHELEKHILTTMLASSQPVAETLPK